MGKFYKTSSGRILCIETEKNLNQEEVDRVDELIQIAMPDDWKEETKSNEKQEDC